MTLKVNGMTIEEIIEGLKARNASEISRDTGIMNATLSNIKTGRTPVPRIQTLERLSKYMLDNPGPLEIMRAKLAERGE